MPTLCTSGAVKLKAGTNVSTAITAAQYDQMIEQAEADLMAEAKIDFVTGYSGYGAQKKLILEEATAAKAALTAIGFDMSNYLTFKEAEILLDVNAYAYKTAIRKIKEKPQSDFFTG